MAGSKEQHACDNNFPGQRSDQTNDTDLLNNLDKLKKYIIDGLVDKTINSDELVRLALNVGDISTVIKDIYKTVRNLIDESELVEKVTQTMIRDIEAEVDAHLEKYSKYTLETKTATEIEHVSTKFFRLISLLRDVSVLGRKLLESSPQWNSFSPDSPNLTTPSIYSGSIDFCEIKSNRSMIGEDATSEDLLAALIESSSTDDFLVLTSSLDSITLRDMVLTVHILMKSHECFTLSHDIQGVAILLRRAKFIILNVLAPKNQMELVTKLLISIGRYREMNYVFDLFRDRNQFELLLSKGVEKTSDLRIALFNYAKKNPEFYALVTLNFSMFREIAESLEASAMKRLDKLISSKENKGQQTKTQRRQRQQQQQQPKKINSQLTWPVNEGSVAAGFSSLNLNQRQGQQSLELQEQQHQPSTTTRSDATNDAGRRRESLFASISSSASMIKSPSFVNQQQEKQHQQQQQPSHSTLKASLSFGKSLDAMVTNPTTASTKIRQGEIVAASLSSDSDKKFALYSKEGLNLCLVELVDAADCFAKAGCHKRSNSCGSRAKLIALQLALLPSGTNVLNLKQSELNDIIVSFELFESAYIVAEAYNYHLAWRQALFKNVILRYAEKEKEEEVSLSGDGEGNASHFNGCMKYLNEFCQKCDLSPALVLELVFLYKQHVLTKKHGGNNLSSGGGNSFVNGSNQFSKMGSVEQAVVFAASLDNEYTAPGLPECSGSSASAMKMVLARLVDVELKFRLYTQLDFANAKDELLQNPATQAYLKDLRSA